MTQESKYWHTNGKENVIEAICPCGFKDRPENFHAIQEFSGSGKLIQRDIYIECPKCGKVTFFQHFFVYPDNETVKNTNVGSKSLSHLYAISSDEKPVMRLEIDDKTFDIRGEM